MFRVYRNNLSGRHKSGGVVKAISDLIKERNTVTIELDAWASYQIRKIAGCACARNSGNVFPHCRFQRIPLVSDPGMHHGTCVTHVPWCMSGSLTCGDGENVPGIPGACAPAILRIWQEAHGTTYTHRLLVKSVEAHITRYITSHPSAKQLIGKFSTEPIGKLWWILLVAHVAWNIPI